jgi:hypothetical protein
MAKTRNKTIEAATAATILQRTQRVALGGIDYDVPPPTLATLILVSEEVSYLPKVTFDSSTAITDALREARNYRGLADIAAIMLLGAKGLEVEEEVTTKLWGIIPRTKRVKVNKKAELADRLMNITISELAQGVAEVLGMMQTEHFFALATFLTNINMTMTTKVAKTTASGL